MSEQTSDFHVLQPLSPQEILDFFGEWDRLGASAMSAPKSVLGGRFGDLASRAAQTADRFGLQMSTKNLRAIPVALRKATPGRPLRRGPDGRTAMDRTIGGATVELAKLVAWAMNQMADAGGDSGHRAIEARGAVLPILGPPSLRPDQVRVMQALRQAGTLLTAIDLAQRIKRSERTVRKLLNELAGAEFGYVEWPRGGHSGARLTSAGVRALTQVS